MTDELEPVENKAMTKAEIYIYPWEDPSIGKIHEAVNKLLGHSRARLVEDIAGAKGATDDLVIISDLKKAIKEEKGKYINPPDTYLKGIKGYFKTSIDDPLLEAEKVSKDKVTAFKVKQERIRQQALQAAEAQRRADELARRVKYETGEMVEKQEEAPVAIPDEVSKSVHGDLGSTGLVEQRHWKLIDESLVPDTYKILDEVKIGKVIRAGGEIPGIELVIDYGLRTTRPGSRE